MDPVVRKLMRLLDTSDVSLRTAAVRVVAELELTSKGVVRALARALHGSDEELRSAALDALSRLGAKDVTAQVLPLLAEPGPLRERAMDLVVELGQPALGQLRNLYPVSDLHGKRAIITCLARIGGRDSLAYLLKLLPDESFELQKHLTVHICEALDRMKPAAQAVVFEPLRKLLRGKSAAASPQLQITGAVVLGHLRGPVLVHKSRELLQWLSDVKQPSDVRRHAVLSFSRLFPERKLTVTEEEYLEKILCDEDWHNVAQHGLTLFERLHIPSTRHKRLVELLHASPHFSVQIHLFDRLRETNKAEVAQAIIPFLSDARFRVREVAEGVLRKMPSAIDSLFGVLVEEEDLDITQRVNSILRDFPVDTRRKYVGKAIDRLLELYEQNDPSYASFLDFVRAVDPEPLRRGVYDKCSKLRSGRSRDRWERMAVQLKLLWDNHLITAEGRYLLAVAHLRLSSKELAPAARRANLGLQVVRALIYNDPASLQRRLVADTALADEDYYYVGFHFVEESDEVCSFGESMLRHVIKRYPRSKCSGAAKRKLEQLEARRESEVGAASVKSRAAARKRQATAGKKAAAAKPAAAAGKKPAGRNKPTAASKTTRKSAKSPPMRIKKGGSATAAKKARKKPARAGKSSR
jgi:HEAT repeat protein